MKKSKTMEALGEARAQELVSLELVTLLSDKLSKAKQRLESARDAVDANLGAQKEALGKITTVERCLERLIVGHSPVLRHGRREEDQANAEIDRAVEIAESSPDAFRRHEARLYAARARCALAKSRKHTVAVRGQIQLERDSIESLRMLLGDLNGELPSHEKAQRKAQKDVDKLIAAVADAQLRADSAAGNAGELLEAAALA